MYTSKRTPNTLYIMCHTDLWGWDVRCCIQAIPTSGGEMSDTIVTYSFWHLTFRGIYMGHTGSTSGGEMSGTAYCPYLPLEVSLSDSMGYTYLRRWDVWHCIWAIPSSGRALSDTAYIRAIPTSGGEMSATVHWPYLPLKMRCQRHCIWAMPTSGHMSGIV